MVRVILLVAFAGMTLWCFARSKETRTLVYKLLLLVTPPLLMGFLAVLAESWLLGAGAGTLLVVLFALAYADMAKQEREKAKAENLDAPV